MSLFSKIFSRKEERKSINSISSQHSSYISGQGNMNNISFQDDKKEIWSRNPDRFYKNTLASLLEKISNTISNVEYTLREKNNEVLSGEGYQEIIDKLENPSLRQQTKKQLIEDMAMEYLTNKLMFLVYKETDGSLYCLKSYEISVHDQSYYDEKIFKSFTINISSQRQLVFTFNPKTQYYYNAEKKIRLYPSELVFEETAKRSYNNVNLVYLKHIFNDIFDLVYLEELITLKNISICETKQNANLLNIFPSGNQMAFNMEDFTQVVQRATVNAQANGSTSVVGSSCAIEAKLIPLNDNNFSMQFLEQYKEIVQKGLFGYFQVPMQFGLEQAKFTNNISGSLEYLENAIIPKTDFIYNFLTKVIQDIFNQPNVFIKPSYNKTSIKQQYDSERSSKLMGILTINESRELNGFPPIVGGDVLPNVNQTQNVNNSLIEDLLY